MPKVSQAHRDARRNQILDAATSCFAQHGIGATTIAKICAKAGLSAGAVYGHFGSKTEILHAVYDRSIQSNQGFADRLSAATDPIATVRGMVAGLVGIISQPALHDAHRLSLRVQAEGLSDPTLAARYAAVHRTAVDSMVPLLERMQQAGQLDPTLDVAYTLRVVVATYQGLRVQALLDDTLDLERFGKAFSRMVDRAFGWEAQK